ncbi:protein Jade-1 [Latimeria chalumnae]|uniref:Protein Jade-1 n=1 Tax=Latimeria chalumnae TaxID=7897 RepID=H3B2M6_LATCH|nr:PREDICTED: protein Jade-1 [Latimeria chalumnae]XP_014341192.1 PREDICTED: protein Jade-1 [Latimeria chalumnae]|eukprot:XP_014341191.1 PREDICTED: protein Jade-1 [Latimeria chalumnae]
MMKRGRLPSSSEDSDDNGSHSTSWSQHSRSQHRRNLWHRHEDRKPSEVFRTDLITAMKLPDSYQLNSDEYYVLADPWRQEWEKGVQVPVSPESILQPAARVAAEKESTVAFSRPRKYIQSSGSEPPELGYVDIRTLAEGVCRYDLNEIDVSWLELINEEFREMGLPEVEEFTMERVMEELEHRCYENMNHAIETEEGLGIEYDEDVVCDVCQSPDGEDGNEMVFCDKCNICVHQACYGILKVPEGSWLCRTCALGVQPKCLLCPKKGGAMKPTRSGTKWVHVSCALWIPEVSIGSPEKMEPITKVSHIPSNRWALVCSICNEKSGASIQCSVKNCRTAFHVTCAFDHGLEMKTILAENDEVKFKSYCLKHSSKKAGEDENPSGTPSRTDENEGKLPAPFDSVEVESVQQESQRVSLRKQKLQQLEDEFYTFVDVSKVAQHLGLPEEVVEFIYQYWKLKRKANFNKPLITPKKDEEDNLAKQEQDVLFRRLQLFTHLRQDLERVRNLTYMVTRREKIKRSVCRVQEQLFHIYVKQLEEGRQRGPGVSSGFSLGNLLFFNHMSPTPGCTKSEGLKWVSNSMEKELGRFSGCLQDRVSHRGEKVRNYAEHGSKPLRKQPSTVNESCSKLEQKSKKEEAATHSGLSVYEKPHFDARASLAVQQRNGMTLPDHRKRRDNRSHHEEARLEAKEKALTKHSYKPLRPTEQTPKPSENKLALNHASGRVVTPSARRLLGDTAPKANGPLSKVNCSHTAVKVPTPPTSPVKNWGGFRIPKKGERHHPGEAQEEKLQRSSGYQHLGLARASARDGGSARLKVDSENDGYVPDAEMSDSETEATETKCRPQRLSSTSTINRRYETDVIRRSILAS